MDKIKNYFLLILFGLIVSCTILNAKDFKSIPFFSFGSQGIGIGINYKGYNLYTRYHYKYEDNANYYAYYHYPSIQLTRNLYKEESGNLYVGLGFSNIFFKQKKKILAHTIQEIILFQYQLELKLFLSKKEINFL
jgi:hypothetical protein